MNMPAALGAVVPAICPAPPPGVEAHANTITSYVMWGVLAVFLLGLLVGVGTIAAGRVVSLPHASKMGVVSVVSILLSAIAYMVLPGMLKTITGSGCVAAPTPTHAVVAARQLS